MPSLLLDAPFFRVEVAVGCDKGPTPVMQMRPQSRGVNRAVQVEYLVIGKTAAILQGYPDTTQDVDLFIEKGPFFNGPSLTRALRELGFELGAEQETDICDDRALIQLRNGPFDVDLVFPGRHRRLRDGPPPVAARFTDTGSAPLRT